MPAFSRPSQKRLLGAAALAVVLATYWHFSSGTAATPTAPHGAPVRVAKVERHDMPVVEHTLGTIIATSTVQLTARVQGTLDVAYFQEGQFVKKGDLLFQIDPRPYQAAMEQAQAVLQRDQALLDNANRDKARNEKLFASNAVSSQQRDTAATSADAATATVAIDKAALDMAQLNLNYTQIRSPIDGKTGPLLVAPGNMISAGATTALVTIAQLQPIKLSLNLPQSDLARIQARLKMPGLTVTIEAQGPGGGALSAPVDFVSNAISNQTGTIELRATFDNRDLSFMPGQIADVTVALDTIPQAIIVPHDAVNDGPDGTYVYVVVDGRASLRAVKILHDDTRSAAVEGDVHPGDMVIVEGQLRVAPGDDVKIFPSNASSISGTGARSSQG